MESDRRLAPQKASRLHDGLHRLRLSHVTGKSQVRLGRVVAFGRGPSGRSEEGIVGVLRQISRIWDVKPQFTPEVLIE